MRRGIVFAIDIVEVVCGVRGIYLYIPLLRDVYNQVLLEQVPNRGRRHWSHQYSIF